MRWAPCQIVRRRRLAALLPAAGARGSWQLKKVALANAIPVRQAVWLQRGGAYRNAAARAFIALLHAPVAGRPMAARPA